MTHSHTIHYLMRTVELKYSQKRFDKKILDLFLFLLFLIQLLSARSLNKDWHAQLTPRHSYTRPFKYPNPHSAGRGPYILPPLTHWGPLNPFCDMSENEFHLLLIFYANNFKIDIFLLRTSILTYAVKVCVQMALY